VPIHACAFARGTLPALGALALAACGGGPPLADAGPAAPADAAARDAGLDAAEPGLDASGPDGDAGVAFDAAVASDAGPDASPDAGPPEPIVCDPVDDFVLVPEEGVIEEASATAVGAGFVVAYAIRVNDEDALRMALLDPCAAVVDPSLPVDESGRFITGAQVAALPDGGFLVGWTQVDGDATDDGVVFQTFEPDGQPRSAVTTANETETDQQVLAGATALPDGVALAWADYSPGAFEDRPNVVMRVFDEDAAPVTGEILLSPAAEGRQDLPRLAATADGALLAAYHEPTQSGRLRRRTADDTWLDAEPILVSVERKLVWSLGAQDGQYALALVSMAVEDRGDVELGLLDTDSGALEVISIAAAAGVVEEHARVAPLPGGGWLVAWTDRSLVEDDNGRGVLALRVGADGAPEGDRFLVPSETLSDQELAALAPGPGGVLVVWTDGSQADGHDGEALRAGLLVHDPVEVAQ